LNTWTPPIDATPQAQPEQGQAADSEESDHSDALFSMYLSMVYHKDNEMVKSWKEDANGMLTFVRLQNISHSFAFNV
jgi:hypothetical protein